jgi:hypothetical protein
MLARMNRTFILVVVLASSATALADKPQHPDQWMFDNKPLTATSASGDPGSLQFKITDHVYARVFFDQTIKDVFGLTDDEPAVSVYEYFSSTKYNSVGITIPKKDFGNKWIDLEILPDPATARTKYGSWSFVSELASVAADKPKGPQELYLNFSRAPSGSERSITIKIDFSGADVQKLEAEDKALLKAGEKAFSANIGVPSPGKLHSAALARQFAAALKAEMSLSAARVIVTDDDWTVEHNEISGAVVSRVGSIALVSKEKDGTCKLDGGYIRQPYVGGRFKGPGEWHSTADTQQIDCAKGFATR